MHDPQALYLFDRQFGCKGPVCGIDEVGRGPLAGPVVAAAVVLPAVADLPGLDDSKKLSPKKRERLAGLIREQAVAWAVGMASVEEIDTLNILEATKLAMERAVADLGVEPELLLVDAVRLPRISLPQESILQGDAKSASVAAASIVAKVARDAMMEAYAGAYPDYGFERHKGYGTKQHIQALRSLGPTPIHRKLFIRNFIGRPEEAGR
ncbi:ribonuclease HII [Anaerotalea alkaliphila]|uniref:Ribonuclease HII n=1 Tax=Anaerotalea alkaliphila TaxID=2662126 RepID=A0A7X5HTE9_9FIRM|nr:ribonuclease HII [Anaerotalea alkaliphila]NDL66309.1 ribonuclease HII [Anaerotalea alkaliphila]